MVGRVISNKMQKSAVVLLEFSVKHPLYQKVFARSKRYLVDDPMGVKLGDIVEFVKVKPISKNKHWQIVKVLGQNFAEVAQVQLKEQAEKQIEEVMPEEKEEDTTMNIENEKQGINGGKQTKVVVDNLADQAKKKSKTRTKSVQK
ncbi:MAG: 30S ribosomal protein S17 [Candidatus Daviesbacteria bacterium]|nr:MAG: 30S ribosomal protein S17 [Candidatus Daviesbacteria bacterium]